MAFSFVYPTPLPSTKGWGPGFPNCDASKIVAHPIFQGGVHRRIKPLVDMLVAECELKGYVFHAGWSWGYGCRGTKASDGSQSSTPSFHSWGLALDFNAPQNPFGAERADSDIASNNLWIVKLMKEYGFFWLGPSIGDWMHFSFCGTKDDATNMIAKAETAGLGQPKLSYKVGQRTFRSLKSAITYVHNKLRHAKAGVKNVIRVIRRK